MYVIDVSNGLGVGVEREEKWQHLRNFISRVNYGMIKDAKVGYIVYDVEPRYLTRLQPCDEKTEAFFAGDPCLCQEDPYLVDKSGVCSTVAPTGREDIEDFGLHGPRTGRALQKAEQMLHHNSTGREKNLIILISHLPTTDNVDNAEAELKSEGTSLIDIEVGDHHDIRRRSSNGIVPANHQMEVSILKLDSAVNSIFSKLCQSPEAMTKKSYILRAHYNAKRHRRGHHRGHRRRHRHHRILPTSQDVESTRPLHRFFGFPRGRLQAVAESTSSSTGNNWPPWMSSLTLLAEFSMADCISRCFIKSWISSFSSVTSFALENSSVLCCSVNQETFSCQTA